MSESDEGTGLVVGLDWWGVGPREMMESLHRGGHLCHALPLWDIRRPLDRLAMRRPIGPLVSDQLLCHRLEQLPTLSWCLVVTPYRLAERSVSRLRRKTHCLVALLGDRPVGRRTVAARTLDLFDLVVVPDASWLDDLPTAVDHVVVEPWGSTVTSPDLLRGDVYRPRRLALVGSPSPERLTLAESLANHYDVTLQGEGWRPKVSIPIRPAAPRLESLAVVRERYELILNVHHTQFSCGLNPQASDYAAAGIPQAIIYADDLHKYYAGPPCSRRDGRTWDDDLLENGWLFQANLAYTECTRRRHLFPHTFERILRICSLQRA